MSQIHSGLAIFIFFLLCFYQIQTSAQYNLGAFWKGVLTQIYTVDSKIVESSMYSADRRDGDSFGQQISVSGDTMVVGAAGHEYDQNGGASVLAAGAAYVYTRSGTTWAFQQKLVPTGTNSRQAADQFGLSGIAIDGDTLIVGSNNSYDASGGNSLSTAGAAWVFTRTGTTWTLQQKLVGTGTNGRMASDSFGSRVSISGETLAVSAPGQDYNATGASSLDLAGAVFVFTRSGTTWTLQQKLVGTGTNGRMASDSFGVGISISGDTLAVGASGQDYNATGASSVDSAGAVFVFTRSGTTWTQQQKLVGTGTNGRVASDSFGQYVSISGDTIAVGVGNQDYDAAGSTSLTSAGAVFVFTRSGTTWTLQQKLVGTGTNGRMASDFFGRPAVSGDTIVVGASGQDYDAAGGSSLSNAGAAFVFTRTGTTWALQQKLVGTGTNGRMASDQLFAVAVSGDTIVAGASSQDYDAIGGTSLNDAGATFVFTRVAETWSDQQKLVATGPNFYSGRVADDYFGYYLSMTSDTLVVSAMYQDYDLAGANSTLSAGAVYVFTRSGTTWAQQQKLIVNGPGDRNANDRLGKVAIFADTLVVGSYNAYDAAGGASFIYAGAAYVFTRSGTIWSQQQKLVGTGTNSRATYDYFGDAVSIYADTIAVGAREQDYNATGASSLTNAGAVFVFTRSGTTWSLQQKLVGTGTNGRLAGDLFGSDVAIYSDTLVAGAYGQDYDAAGATSRDAAGAAFVFTRSGTTWTLQQKLVGTGTNGRLVADQLGGSVAISADTIVVGASYQDYDSTGANSLDSAGAAYIFTRSGTTWTQQKKIVGQGHNGRLVSDRFGYSVKIDGNIVVVNTGNHHPYDSGGNNSKTDAGAVFVFSRSGTAWTHLQKLVGQGTNGRMATDYFGTGFSVIDNMIAVGAGGQDYDSSGAGASGLSNAGAAWVFSAK